MPRTRPPGPPSSTRLKGAESSGTALVLAGQGASLRYRTNDVARAVGVHPSTVRRFDKRGLLSPKRTWAGHRRYSAEDLARLRELVGLPPDDSEAGLPDPETITPKVPS